MIYEKEWGNPNYKFLSYDVDNLNWNMHYHESFEICFIINGEINIIIDTDCYNLKQNDSVIIFPRQLHSYETAQRHTRNFQPGYKKQICLLTYLLICLWPDCILLSVANNFKILRAVNPLP